MITNNAIYQISGADLKEFANELISSTKKELEQEIAEQKAEKYLSTQQVCDMLSLDPTTIWRHCKRGILLPIFIGGKKRFKLSEIRKIMEGK